MAQRRRPRGRARTRWTDDMSRRSWRGLDIELEEVAAEWEVWRVQEVKRDLIVVCFFYKNDVMVAMFLLDSFCPFTFSVIDD